jgi:O-antigen/teichoic acid export membrane protein
MLLSRFFNTKNIRTKKLQRNIIISIIMQGVSMAISLILLPVSLKFVSVEQYGVWLTISSILMWTANFDLGLGLGLKNRLAEALAKEDYTLARKYVSTAYTVIILIMGSLSIIYFSAAEYINWVKLFNLNETYSELIQRTINVIIYLFFARFVLQLINIILDALQLLYIAKIIGTSSQLLILSTIFLLSNKTEGNIYLLGLIFSLAPVLVFTISSFIVFSKYDYLRPSFKFIHFSFAKDLYGLGLKFFLIQISMLVLFQTSNILIINFFGPEQVVQYNVAFSLFSMINIAFSTISAPYWTAYTNAWTLGDKEWIKKTNQKLFKIWLFIISAAFIVLIFSNQIYLIWLRKDLNIPFSLSLAIYLYICTFSFGGIYNMFINSTGKVHLQILSLVISSLLYIPILLLFIKVFGWGLISFPIALMIISNYSVLLAPLQFKKLLNGTAKGIWAK